MPFIVHVDGKNFSRAVVCNTQDDVRRVEKYWQKRRMYTFTDYLVTADYNEHFKSKYMPVLRNEDSMHERGRFG